MAGVSVEGGKGGRRALDSEINMIPMIDLLMVTISFLLITAVWVNMGRLEASANAPAKSDTALPPPKAEPALHVSLKDETYVLEWKMDGAVLEHTELPRNAKDTANDALRDSIRAGLAKHGVHQNKTDLARDRLVLHTQDREAYRAIVSVMDAVASIKRAQQVGPKTGEVGAFEVVFAIS